jgi:thioester reductase-like protein
MSTTPSDRAQLTGNVLLTGATGYLGAHLLRDLLETSQANVVCLVRGETQEAAEKNLARQIAWSFPGVSFEAFAPRIEVLRGDMGAPFLGLDARGQDRVSEHCGTIINAAADVHHVGAASRSFRINTEAVATLLELARRGAGTVFHQVSTVSVRGTFKGAAKVAAFKETHLEEGQQFGTNGAYEESKYRAEVLMRRAFEAGLKGAVYRVGYVGPHSVTARFQRNIHQSDTALYLRACVRLGLVPYTRAGTVQLTPVDSVSRAMLLLASQAPVDGRTYYLEHPQVISQREILRVLNAAGYSIRLLEEADFVAKASYLSNDDESLARLMPLPDCDADEQRVPIDSVWTQRELRKVGFEYPRITSGWLGRFLAHAIEVGFMEAPRFWNLAPLPDDLL